MQLNARSGDRTFHFRGTYCLSGHVGTIRPPNNTRRHLITTSTSDALLIRNIETDGLIKLVQFFGHREILMRPHYFFFLQGYLKNVVHSEKITICNI